MTMDTLAVNANFASGASTTTEAIKEAVTWCGHNFKIGFEKLADFVKLCWNRMIPLLRDTVFPFIKQTAKDAWYYARSPLGIGISAFVVTGTLFGISEACAHNKNDTAALALKIAAYVFLAGIGAIFIVGAVHGFTTPLFGS